MEREIQEEETGKDQMEGRKVENNMGHGEEADKGWKEKM